MIKPVPSRDTVLYIRIQKVNKEFITEKAKIFNMNDSSFLDQVFTLLRTTTEGQALIALDVDNEGHKRKAK